MRGKPHMIFSMRSNLIALGMDQIAAECLIQAFSDDQEEAVDALEAFGMFCTNRAKIVNSMTPEEFKKLGAVS